MPSAVLVFEGTKLKVPLEGGVDALSGVVERKLGLHAGSFDIFDDYGKVDSPLALRRALTVAGPAPAGDGEDNKDMVAAQPMPVLQVRERPEWKKMREMDAKIEMLIQRCPVEDKVMQATISSFREMDAKVEMLIQRCPVEDKVLEAINDRVSAKAKDVMSELDEKMKSVAPLLQHMAQEQINMKVKLDRLSTSVSTHQGVPGGFISVLSQLADSTEAAHEQLDGVKQYFDSKMEALEEATKELRSEIKVKDESAQSTHDSLKAEVKRIEKRCTAALQKQQEQQERQQQHGQDEDKQKPMSPKSASGWEHNAWKAISSDSEANVQWLDGSSTEHLSGFSYSKKSHRGVKGNGLHLGGMTAVPFARPRQLDRLAGSTSLPFLPTMQ